MKRSVFAIFLSTIAILVAVTNPDLADHKAKVKEKLFAAQALQEIAAAPDSSRFNSAQSSRKLMADKVIDATISRNGFVFFSLTRATWKGESKIIGVGLLDNVFIIKDFEIETKADSEK